MTRHLLALSALASVLALAPAWAQEANRIDGDKAKEVAKAVADAVAKLDLPVKASLDGKAGVGLHAEKSAVFVVPDAKLTAEALKKHDKGTLPVGVLVVTDSVTLVAGDKPLPSSAHLTADVTVGDKTLKVNAIALAAGRVADRLVLLAYAKDKSPVVVCELAEDEDKSEHTLDVSARKSGDKRATLVVNVAGRYKACLHLAAKED